MFAREFGDGDIFLWLLWLFMFVIWFWLLITIFGDLFRDQESSGAAKAGWVVLVLVLPFVGILLYLIIRGGGMTERAQKEMESQKASLDAYVRQTTGSGSAADQIATAKALLDAGTIDQAEFDQLKAKALG